MRELRTVCVYAGARPGAREEYGRAASSLARLLAERGIGLVYGGGRVGMMGTLADSALAAGGRVTGIIPEALSARELAHTGLSDLRVVASMHERKALMAELSDAFVALPGGVGTLEELVEVFTWSQLGLHRKPVAVLDVGGYYEGLVAFFDHAVSEGFLGREARAMLLVASDPEELLDRLAAWEAPDVPRILDRDDT